MTTNLHNPDGLTAEQVGQGWRLLTQEEVRKLPSDAEVWAFTGEMVGHWKPSQMRGSQGFAPMSYRTRIEQEPIPTLAHLPTEPGEYRVQHLLSGNWFSATVRKASLDGEAEANIPDVDTRWHHVVWLQMQRWGNWTKVTR